MAVSKEKKKQMLLEIQEKLVNSKAVIFVEYTRTKVADMQDLRKELREQKITLRVVKNTLLKKVLKDKNLTIDNEILHKPLLIAFDKQDEVAPAKIVSNKSKQVKTLKILGALVNGEFFDSEKVKQLAKIPSREQLYAQIVGSVKAPISGLLNVLTGNVRGLINVLNQYKLTKSK